MRAYLDFERPIAELEDKIEELRQLADAGGQVDIDDEVARLQAKADQLLIDTYAKLTPSIRGEILTQNSRYAPQRHRGHGEFNSIFFFSVSSVPLW